VTYETMIGIEIAGIRRAIPLRFQYRIKTINGKRTPIHDSVAILSGGRRLPGDWVYEAIGVRQLMELDDLLLAHSTFPTPAAAAVNAARRESERKIA
jgi:hypothetical protein